MKTSRMVAFAVLSALLLASIAFGQSHFATLYTFTGYYPTGLTYANGAFYGATYQFGNCGTVFELQPPAAPSGEWTETTLYAFPIQGDACYPTGALVVASSGLYGVTEDGGANLGGAAYELQPPTSLGGAWTENVIYSFAGLGEPGGDGGFPTGLFRGPAGSLYVTTCCGGTLGEGSVFELTPPASPAARGRGRCCTVSPLALMVAVRVARRPAPAAWCTARTNSAPRQTQAQYSSCLPQPFQVAPGWKPPFTPSRRSRTAPPPTT